MPKICERIDCIHGGKPQSKLNFYKSSLHEDGRQGHCKDCARSDAAKRRQRALTIAMGLKPAPDPVATKVRVKAVGRNVELTESQLLDAKRLLERGYTLKIASAKFGVSSSCLHDKLKKYEHGHQS